MIITVNGVRCEFPPQIPLDRIVATLSEAENGIAVALNEEVVQRSQWSSTLVTEGSFVEVITALQGG